MIYKTTNLLNGKYYIGMHSTSDLGDGYLGSGRCLRYAIRKYGRSNFKYEILEFLSNREKLVERERELVTTELVFDRKCMNLQVGGGSSLRTEHTGGDQWQGANRYWAEPGNRERKRKIQSDKNKRLWCKPEYRIKMLQNLGFDGHTHTTASKHRIGQANSIAQRGERNSQFGTCWITDGMMNKKVKRDGLELPTGWRMGRSLKY